MALFDKKEVDEEVAEEVKVTKKPKKEAAVEADQPDPNRAQSWFVSK
jgi:hypothetical protein